MIIILVCLQDLKNILLHARKKKSLVIVTEEQEH